MGCDKCGAELEPGESFTLTPRGKLCPPCTAPIAVAFRGRCAACQQGVDPQNPRTKIYTRLDGRRLCGYCGPPADAVFQRADRLGGRRARGRR